MQRFTIPGKPVSKNGDRVKWIPYKYNDNRRYFKGKNGKMKQRQGYIMHYIDQDVLDYGKKVEYYVLAKKPKRIAGAVELTIYIGVKPPESIKGTKRKMCFKEDRLLDVGEDMILMPTTKPDTDNLNKNIMDSIKNHLFVDDSYVCSLHVHKRFEAEDYVAITVKEIGIPCQLNLREIKEFLDSRK